MEKDPEMGLLGYKQLTITAKYTDKKKMHSPITREVHPIFYGLSILYHFYPLVEDVTDRELDRIG